MTIILTRKLYNELLIWKASPDRRPLIIRGARQVGKSFLIKEFAKNNFQQHIEINFEQRPELKAIFESRDSKDILKQLSRIFDVPVEAEKTLLFIDEIQDCPTAFLALRYFFEQTPEIPVVAAGSLFDFMLHEQDSELRVPVGRIEYKFLHPLSFIEYLAAFGRNGLSEEIKEISLKSPPSESVHHEALKEFGNYILVGGMPAAVDAARKSLQGARYQQIQASILQTYRDDFRKYSGRVDVDALEKIYRRLPNFICKKFKYSELYPDGNSRTTKRVLDLFEMARVLTKVMRSSGNGLPLEAEADSNDYKLLFVDIGLMSNSLQIPAMDLAKWNTDLINSGQITEQCVGQELLAYSESFRDPRLYYWSREKKGSAAEVDYIIGIHGKVFPLEVKAGTTGKLKSLHSFVDMKSSMLGIRISQQPLSLFERTLSVPIYAVSALPKVVTEVLSK